MMGSVMTKVNFKAAKLVKSERVKRGWTQSHLAEVASLSERTVQRFEKDGVAGKDSLLAFASALGLEIERLTEEEPPKKPENLIKKFPLIMNGKEALDLVWKADLYEYDYFGVEGEATKTIAAIFEFLSDAGDLSYDVEISDRISWTESLNSLFAELKELGLLTFGRRYRTKLCKEKVDEIEMSAVTIYIVPFTHPGIGMDSENERPYLRVQVPSKKEVKF